MLERYFISITYDITDPIVGSNFFPSIFAKAQATPNENVVEDWDATDHKAQGSYKEEDGRAKERARPCLLKTTRRRKSVLTFRIL